MEEIKSWLKMRINKLQEEWNQLMLEEPKDLHKLIRKGSQKTAYNTTLEYINQHEDGKEN